MHDCCDPILHGWFKAETLYKLGLRHGVDCPARPGTIEELAQDRWFYRNRRVLTGEVYS